MHTTAQGSKARNGANRPLWRVAESQRTIRHDRSSQRLLPRPGKEGNRVRTTCAVGEPAEVSDLVIVGDPRAKDAALSGLSAARAVRPGIEGRMDGASGSP